MIKATRPLTYRDQALLVGYTVLGEGMDFIAAELGRTQQATELAYKDILAAFQGIDLIPLATPAARPKPPISPAQPAEAAPKRVAKWQPRRFRVLPVLSRTQSAGTRDVTAALMGDPSAAAFERSLQSPPPFRPDPRYSKRIF